MPNDEKKVHDYPTDIEVMRPDGDLVEDMETQVELNATKADLAMAAEQLDAMSLERCKAIMGQVFQMHAHDQNFPETSLADIKELLQNPDVVANPEKHAELIHRMKLEAILVTENSPYAEVRAVVDNTDDVSMPSLTFRVWVIGIVFSGAGAFINQLFSIRQPAVYVSSQVAQLLAWPVGKLFERILPEKEYTLFGRRFSLNPGKFNKKEHMLITIMATVAFNTPYTGNIVFTQAMPQYFNKPGYAKDFGYQILNTIGTNFVGYGLAGLCRRFIVYPSFCVWPSSLTVLAINKAFHSDDSDPVPGPLKRVYRWSRMRIFVYAFVSMFIYWWFPGFIFQALSTFNWMSWIAPNNTAYNNIVGFNNGLGLNPWPTFDYNVPSWNGWTPMVIPLFSVMNQWAGMLVAFIMIIGVYWTNTWETGYLPINSNKVFDNTGSRYNVSLILDDEGMFNEEKYQQYSEPYMSAGNTTVYFWFFALYTATISYAALYHRHELSIGFKGFWRNLKRSFKKGGNGQFGGEDEEDLGEDIHFRLMRSYKEVPEWWYFVVLVISLGIGCAGIGAYPTHTSPGVVIYGIVLAVLFVIPTGLIAAVTGVQVTMNVLAEFIGGGAFARGDALALNYFKMYGYIVPAQALYFANDLKLAHYVKIPPIHTFAAQMVATVVSTFVCTAIFNFQLGFRDVCTSTAAFGMSCPGENTFFTAAVFWGTLGPVKLFGPGGRYQMMLLGFPIGFALPIIFFYLTKWLPKQKWLRSVHPVMLCAGGILFSPYNLSYMWPMVMITWFSWGYIKPRYLAFWSRYNYIIAAAWSAAIAVAAIIIFFSMQIPNLNINWWGNNVPWTGCEAEACVRLEVPAKGYFGKEPGHFT